MTQQRLKAAEAKRLLEEAEALASAIKQLPQDDEFRCRMISEMIYLKLMSRFKKAS